MTEQSAVSRPAATAPAARLEPDAIGAAQDTIIGMANAGPVVSVGLTMAALVAVTAYGSGPVILITAIPMLIIANAYRRLNMWNANCGASFEWVGRAINPYLGFMTGWLMIAGSLIGSVSGVVVLAPSVLAVFGSNASAKWPNVLIATGVSVVLLVIAIVGIRLTARTQVGLAAIEYGILIAFSIFVLIAVISHHPGTFPISRGWFTLSGIGGKGSAASGFLLAVFMYTGWDATIYVNEEVKHRRLNPGRAAMMAVFLLALIFTLGTVGLQGGVSPAKLQANATSAPVYVIQQLAGGGWAKVMALALALSVIAATLCGIVVIARIVYGMATRRVLPEFLATVSRRFSTPAAATLVVGLVLIAALWVYLLATSVQNAFSDLINVTGLLYAAFYVLTALATMVFYRRRVFSGARDALTLGLLPLAASGFLVWIVVKSLMNAPGVQRWSVVGVVIIGLILMLVARFGLRSPFFGLPRETASDNIEAEAARS
jgi:amino acid transporter